MATSLSLQGDQIDELTKKSQALARSAALADAATRYNELKAVRKNIALRLPSASLHLSASSPSLSHGLSLSPGS